MAATHTEIPAIMATTAHETNPTRTVTLTARYFGRVKETLTYHDNPAGTVIGCASIASYISTFLARHKRAQKTYAHTPFVAPVSGPPPAPPAPVVATEDAIKGLGSEWHKGDKHRVYFNDLCGLYGLVCRYYGTGNVASATLDGEKISNSEARRIGARLADGKLWFDLTERRYYTSGLNADDRGYIMDELKRRVGAERERLAALTLAPLAA